MFTSNLLTLKGVFPRELMTAKPHIPSAVITGSSCKSTGVYQAMPNHFTSVEEWPKSTNLRCWYCDLAIIGYPRFIPTNPSRDAQGRDVCDVHGHFHEWNCAVRYAMNEFTDDAIWDALQLISLFETKFSGKYRPKILPSPPKTIMRQYSGENGITVAQYREKIDNINTGYNLNSYKLSHFTA